MGTNIDLLKSVLQTHWQVCFVNSKMRYLTYTLVWHYLARRTRGRAAPGISRQQTISDTRTVRMSNFILLSRTNLIQWEWRLQEWGIC